MATTRSRAIEISQNPADIEAGYVECPDIYGAKIEADAHLAIVADKLLTDIENDDVQQARVLARFSKNATDQCGMNLNPGLDVDRTIDLFCDAFAVVYENHRSIGGILEDTELGKMTTRACARYAELAAPIRAQIPGNDPRSRHFGGDYTKPQQVLKDGLFTFGLLMHDTVSGVNKVPLSLTDRAEVLRGSSKGMRKLASISIGQTLSGTKRSDHEIVGGGLDIVPNIADYRAKPKHIEALFAQARPHTGCVAMPNLPSNEMLHGGSAIDRLWNVASDLAVRANLHAFDSMDPDHMITGYGPWMLYEREHGKV